jgi:hypothetical protein
MRRSGWAGVASLATCFALSSGARAEDVAAAEALFSRGLADMLAGKYATGCPALAESHRLDPRPGTLFTLAECEAKAGKVATASARYQDYLEAFARLPADKQAKQRGREKDATRARAELAPLVPQLELALPAGAPKDVVVKRDGSVVGGPSLGVPLPVDPGEHTASTEVPGSAPVEVKFSLAKGEKKRVELPLPAAPAAATPVATPVAPAAAAPSQPPAAPPPDGPKPGSTQRTIGFVVGGVGLAGLVVGGVTGGLAVAKKSTVSSECDADTHLCSHDGKVAADAGKTMALVSTVGFGVGLGGVAIGTVLLLTAPSKPKSDARSPWSFDVAAGPRDLALGVGRRF